MNKDQFIRVYVTDAEKKRFELLAETAGLSLSAWARMVLKQEVQKQEKTVGE